METQVYTVSEIQKFLGIGRTAAYDFLNGVYKKQAPFRVIKVGKSIRVLKSSFDEWINNPAVITQ